MRDHHDAWPRIDAWLLSNAAHVAGLLRAPASPNDLARLAAALGRPIPPSIVDAYRAHDGAKGEHPTLFGAVRAPKDGRWARSMWWLPIDGAIGQLALLRDIGDWPEELLPIAADGGGNLIVVDVATGRVSAWDHEDWSTTALADDFGAWMTHLADDMDAKLVVAGSIDDDEDDAIMLLDAPPPSAATPLIAPDRAARVLLACLLERRLVAVAGEDVEGLIVQLHGALATKSPAQRRRRVIAVLEESASIDEIFATDDVLGVLVDELA